MKPVGGKTRSMLGAARMAGAALVSAAAVVSALPPQAVAAEPAVQRQPVHKASPQLSQPWTQQEITNALARLATAVRESRAKPKQHAPSAHAQSAQSAQRTRATGTRQALASAKSALEQPETVDPDSEDADADVSEEDAALPAEMNRGAGYDQITALALQDPDTAHALHMLARVEDGEAISAAADADEPNAGGGDDDPPSDPALTSVLSLNNGPILYQPPCPFGWPPPDRYGGLADIIELAPMAGSFVSEAFAPAAAWQPMAQLFGPLIAIIQPTIKPNRYWINPTIINVQNPINAVHFLFFGWYDKWHRQKFLTEEVEWANEVAPWLQQVYQTPQAACFVAFEGMFQRLVETGNPWPRGWYVEDHATTWDIDKIGPYEPASPGSRPKALQDLDRQLAIEDGDVPAPAENVPPTAPAAPSKPAPAQPPQQPVPPPRQDTPPPQAEPPPRDSFAGIETKVEVR